MWVTLMINECRWYIRESPDQYGRLGIYMEEPLIIATASIILDVGRGPSRINHKGLFE